MIKNYYYSPAYNVDEFRCDLYDDSAHYERLILPNASTDITCFYNSNGSMTRIEKNLYISKFSETHKHLLVCYAGGTNCNRCVKCRRTMLELYFTGELENYIDSFPVDEFLKHKKKHIIWFLSKRHREPVMRQISEYAKNSEKKIPWYYYILGDFRAAVAFGVKIILWCKQKIYDVLNNILMR